MVKQPTYNTATVPYISIRNYCCEMQPGRLLPGFRAFNQPWQLTRQQGQGGVAKKKRRQMMPIISSMIAQDMQCKEAKEDWEKKTEDGYLQERQFLPCNLRKIKCLSSVSECNLLCLLFVYVSMNSLDNTHTCIPHKSYICIYEFSLPKIHTQYRS